MGIVALMAQCHGVVAESRLRAADLERAGELGVSVCVGGTGAGELAGRGGGVARMFGKAVQDALKTADEVVTPGGGGVVANSSPIESKPTGTSRAQAEALVGGWGRSAVSGRGCEAQEGTTELCTAPSVAPLMSLCPASTHPRLHLSPPKQPQARTHPLPTHCPPTTHPPTTHPPPPPALPPTRPLAAAAPSEKQSSLRSADDTAGRADRRTDRGDAFYSPEQLERWRLQEQHFRWGGGFGAWRPGGGWGRWDWGGVVNISPS